MYLFKIYHDQAHFDISVQKRNFLATGKFWSHLAQCNSRNIRQYVQIPRYPDNAYRTFQKCLQDVSRPQILRYLVQDNSSSKAGCCMLRPDFGFRPAVLKFYGWKICKICHPTRYLVQSTASEGVIRPSFKVPRTFQRYKIPPFDDSQLFVNLSRFYSRNIGICYYRLYLILHFTRILFI